MSAQLAVVDPDAATALEIRSWAVAVREQIPAMEMDELAQLEALLRAVKSRLQQLGSEVDEAERTRIRAVQRIGELLGPAKTGGDGSNQHRATSLNGDVATGQERNRDHRARLLAKYPDVVDQALAGTDCSLSAVVRACQDRRTADAPESEWSDEELVRHKLILADHDAVVTVHITAMPHLVAWASTQGRYVRIDRKSDWGNPFVMPEDGDRDEVIRCYRDHYLPYKPSLRGRLGELRGMALGCWCAPLACHGDVLREAVLS